MERDSNGPAVTGLSPIPLQPGRPTAELEGDGAAASGASRAPRGVLPAPAPGGRPSNGVPDLSGDAEVAGGPVLVEDAIVLPPRPVPRSGWRLLLAHMTSGRVVPPLSRQERAERDREEAIRAPLHGCRKIVVVSRKGGVGKSTVTALAGATLSSLRGDRVIAVDCNPDAGTLAYRVARDHERTITDLLRASDDSLQRYQDLRRFTSQDVSSRLEVLASNVDPRVTGSLTAENYEQAFAVLERHFTLVVVDTGTDIRHAAARSALDVADQLLVVVPPSLDGARAAAQTLDWLEEHDHGDLADDAVAVLNGADRHPPADHPRLVGDGRRRGSRHRRPVAHHDRARLGRVPDRRCLARHLLGRGVASHGRGPGLPRPAGAARPRSTSGALVLEPIEDERATRDVNRAIVADVTDDHERTKRGFVPTAERDAQHRVTRRRARELADGYGDYRYSAYVTVTAADVDALRVACGETERKARQAKLRLRRLYGQQDLAFTYTLPLGRGLRGGPGTRKGTA